LNDYEEGFKIVFQWIKHSLLAAFKKFLKYSNQPNTPLLIYKCICHPEQNEERLRRVKAKGLPAMSAHINNVLQVIIMVDNLPLCHREILIAILWQTL
jgi:hypothetical protein